MIVKYRVERTKGEHAHISVYLAPDDRNYAYTGTLTVRTEELDAFRNALVANSVWEGLGPLVPAAAEARYPGEPGSLADIGRRAFEADQRARAGVDAHRARWMADPDRASEQA